MFAARQGYQSPVIRKARVGQALNSAIIGTGQSYFGRSSFQGGSTRYTKWTPGYDVGSADFTIELWVRFNVNSSGQMLACNYTTNNPVLSWALFTASAGKINYFLSSTGGTWNLASGTEVGSFVIDTWYHVALVRSGSTFTPYLNGTAGTTTTSSAALNNNGQDQLLVGGNDTNRTNGWIDEYRFSNTARYTANFTPPTQPFINDANTILLCHFDGPDASNNFLDDNT